MSKRNANGNGEATGVIIEGEWISMFLNEAVVRAKDKVEAPITCKSHDPESGCPELKAHNSFTVNALGQLGSDGTL
jgi:hypothetical protein